LSSTYFRLAIMQSCSCFRETT